MELRIFVLLCSIFFCDKIAAHSPTWTLQPNICVAPKVGDKCQLSLSIKTKNIPTELFCLFLDGQLLTCSQQAYFPQKVTISIRQDALLELKNKQHKTVLTKKLLIKYFEPQDKRRRIRAPWSLF